MKTGKDIDMGSPFDFFGEISHPDYNGENTDPVPLLYQTGYLTIKGYDSSSRTYTVGFPNNEVKYGFLNSFLPQNTPDSFSGSGRC